MFSIFSQIYRSTILEPDALQYIPLPPVQRKVLAGGLIVSDSLQGEVLKGGLTIPRYINQHINLCKPLRVREDSGNVDINGSKVIPVDTVSLPCWWWPVIKDMPQMSITGCTEHLGSGHEND
jgi:hypothetical protein